MTHVYIMLVILVLLIFNNCFTKIDANFYEDETPKGPRDDYGKNDGKKPCGEGEPTPPNPPDNNCQNATLKCGDNEVLDKCPSYCPSDFCPTGDGQNQKCPNPNPCPPPACKCRFNYRRAQNGSCIPTRECPSFECNKPNEEYNPCPPYCPTDKCDQATPTGKCPLLGRIGIVVECRPTCRCKKGYWRNNGTCVPYNQCPGKLTCGPNEVVDNCPANCSTDCCPTSNDENQTCTKPCQCPPPACKCQFNYRRAQNGTCIPTRDCPPFECSKPNEVYKPCPPYCPSDNCSQATPEGKCPLPGRIGVVLECFPKCRCKDKYWRNNGVCVPYDECPGKLECAPGEVVDNCPAVCNTDYCPTNEWDVRQCYVPKPCLKPACRCPFNHLRAKNGTCIPASSCPPFKCRRPNEEFNSCPPFCPSDNCKQATPDGHCPIPGRIGITVECRPGCRCKKSFWRQNGTCVPFGQCDPMFCYGDNEYLDCVTECPPEKTCKNREIFFSCTAENQQFCRVKCVCKKNLYRNSNGNCVRAEFCDN